MSENNIIKITKEENEKYLKGLVHIDPDYFKKMKTDQGKTVSDLNNQGFTVLLYFVRALACPFCNEALEDIYELYPTLLKLNTMPIIIYKEKKEDFEEYLDQDERTQRYKILMTMKNEGYWKEFGLKRLNTDKIKKNQNRILSEKERIKQRDITPGKLTISEDLATVAKAIFIIKNERVVSQYLADVPYGRIDIAKVVLDPDNLIGLQIKNSVFECKIPKRKFTIKKNEKGRVFLIENKEEKVKEENIKEEEIKEEIKEEEINEENIKEEEIKENIKEEIKEEIKDNEIIKEEIKEEEIKEEIKKEEIEKEERRYLNIEKIKKIKTGCLGKTKEIKVKDQIPILFHKEILENDRYRNFLKVQMAKEFQIENLIFYEEITFFYKNITDQQTLILKAKEIYDTFFSDISDYELNISNKEKSYLVSQLNNPNVDLFDFVIKQVLINSVYESINRFLISENYKDMILEAFGEEGFIIK
jgi:peroxiredoxin